MSTAHPPPSAGSSTTTTTATSRPSLTPSPTSVDSAMMTTMKKGSEKLYPLPCGTRTGNGNDNGNSSLTHLQVPPRKPDKNTNTDRTTHTEAKATLDESSQTKRVGSPQQQSLASNETQQQSQMFSKSTSEVSMTSSDASHSEPWEPANAKANPTFPALSINIHGNGNINAQILKKRPFHTEPDPVGVPDKKKKKVMQDRLAIIYQESAKVELTRSVPAAMGVYVQKHLVPIAPAPAQEQPKVEAVPPPLPPLRTPPPTKPQLTMQYAPIMPKPATTTTAAAMVPDCLSRQEGAYLRMEHSASQPRVPMDHTNHNNMKPPDLTAIPSSYPFVTFSSAAPPQAGHVLQKPVFPTSLAPPTTATAPKDASETTTTTQSTNSSVTTSVQLRTQTMQATDCLLLAASLLQETIPPVPSYPSTKDGTNRQPSPTTRNCHQDACAAATPKLPLPAYTSQHHATTHSQEEPRELDVLCGRGGLINKHVGNIIYRRVVEHNKSFYQSVPKRHRILVSQSIVHTILRRGGRFLSEDTKTIRHEDGTISTVTLWKTVATARAIQKTSQALRERVAAVAVKRDTVGSSTAATAEVNGDSR